MMGGTTDKPSVVGEVKAVETPPAVAKIAAPAQAQSNVQKTHLAKVETKEEVKAEIARVFGPHATTALCIAFHESGYQAKVTGPKRWVNGVLHIGNRDGSRDRGVFQLNSRWHAEVSDAQAYDAKQNIAHAYRISKGGTDWHQWATRGSCGA